MYKEFYGQNAFLKDSPWAFDRINYTATLNFLGGELVMKKNAFWILLIVISVITLCSCKEGVDEMLFDNSSKKADIQMGKIIETLKNKDHDNLKAMFSKQVLSEVSDFDRDIDMLFNYIKGDIKTWESTGTHNVSEKKNADGTGSHKKEVKSTYIFETSEQEYQVALYEYTIDTADPDNVGIYSFCVICKRDNPYSEFAYWGSAEAGINIGEEPTE